MVQRLSMLLHPQFDPSIDHIELFDDEYVKDGMIYCSTCNTERTAPAWKHMMRKPCECQAQHMHEKESRERSEQSILAREAMIEKLKEQSNLGRRYHCVSFDGSRLINPSFSAAAERCKAFCDGVSKHLSDGTGLYIHGAVGMGKTHLTACIANDLIEQNYSVYLTTMGEISKGIRATFDSGSDETEQSFTARLEKTRLLFIDDIGTEQVKRNGQDLWLQEKLFDVVNARYNDMRPIVYTSNYSIPDLFKRGVSEKTVDRIVETCQIIEIVGKSFRRQQ